jgi:hypothetical protein
MYFNTKWHQLWSETVLIESPKLLNEVCLRVPFRVDPSIRSASLAEWPRPTPLPHDTENSVLCFTTDGPYFEYRVLLEVMVSRHKRGRGRLSLAQTVI